MLSLVIATQTLFVSLPLSLSIKDFDSKGQINKIAYEWIKHYLNEYNEFNDHEVTKC